MFKLSIECTKDIDAISITFSDGKMATVKAKEPELHSRDDQVVSETSTTNTVPSAVVAKPCVPDTTNRDVNVANNLQNLDI